MSHPTRTAVDQAATLGTALGALRHAIQRYWDEHDSQPGASNPDWFADQLCQATNILGQVGTGEDFCFGPYLEHGELPVNPFTGTADVRVVDAWPTQPDEHEAWIYNRVSGEIRANVIGAGPDGHRFFNL
jgi:hypothetical protein